MNFAGLEPQLSDKVYTTRVSTLSGNQTERGRIEILSTENEIRMVQDIDGRGLDLKPDSFRDRYPLRHTEVEVEVPRAVEAVHREIAEGTRSGGRYQSGLYFRGGNFAGRIVSDVQDIWVDEKNTARCLEQAHVVFEIGKADTGQLRPIISRGAGTVRV